jgi:hypothetical protein
MQLVEIVNSSGLAEDLESGAMSHVTMRTGIRLHVDPGTGVCTYLADITRCAYSGQRRPLLVWVCLCCAQCDCQTSPRSAQLHDGDCTGGVATWDAVGTFSDSGVGG